MSQRMPQPLENDRIERVSRCVYSAPLETTNEGRVFRKDFYSSFLIQHSNSDYYRWKVHIGDVVAVSTQHDATNWISMKELDDWQPNHLTEASPHWKVGLVVALVHVVDTTRSKDSTYECHVEWLEKTLDTSFAPKLGKVYRKGKKSGGEFQIPHLLLRSYKFAATHPANLLPAKITMVADAEWKNMLSWDPEDKFSFAMHCPYFILNESKYQLEEAKDAWVDLNHASFKKSGSSKIDGAQQQQSLIPRPLQQSWARWEPFRDDDHLQFAMIKKGFQDTRESKYLDALNRQVREDKHRYEEEQHVEKQRAAKKKRPASGRRVSEQENNGNDEGNAHKRVRIREPGDTPKTATRTTKKKPAKASSAVRSIIKSKVPSKLPQASATARSTPSAKAKPAASTSPRPHTVILSKLQKSVIVQAPPETKVHTGKYQGQACQFYERVQLVPSKEGPSRIVCVGQLVAVVKEAPSGTVSNQTEPFDRAWGVAQVVALYHIDTTKKWKMHVRWLLGLSETTPSIQDNLRQKIRKFDTQSGLLETMKVGVLPIAAILPVTVLITSAAHMLPTYQNALAKHQELKDADTFPELCFRCQHLQKVEDGPFKMNKDWTDFTADSSRIKGPMFRLLQCKGLTKTLIEKYRQEIRNRGQRGGGSSEEEDDSDVDSMEVEDEDLLPTIDVSPMKILPMYQRWCNKFHDGVRVDIEGESLHRDFAPKTKQWTVKVGYVVPIRLTHDILPYFKTSKAKCWYPFKTNWSPGQIVSIYQDESNKWKMQVRWFERFPELLDCQKEGLGNLNKPHVLFETEVYDHLDVDSCLPGRVVLTSSPCDNWDVLTSGLSGLPFIPRFCSHFCIEEDIDQSCDWTDYDASLSSYPRPLARGLLLDPINRTNKEWILMLSRYYHKFVKSRGKDPDEAVLRTWSGKVSNPLGNYGMIAYDADQIPVTFGAVLLSSPMDSRSKREFSRTLRLALPVKYIALPSRPIQKAKKLSYSVKLGDVVCFYDEKAGQKSDHIMMKTLKYLWFPYSVPWTFGQVTAVSRDVIEGLTQSPMVEIRRFYRHSDLPAAVHPFVPLGDDDKREEIFESDNILERVPAAFILGLAQVYLGHHTSTISGTKGGKSDSLVSCRCKYFYYSNRRCFQPLAHAGFSPKIWAQRLFHRGTLLSRTRFQYKGLHDVILSDTKQDDILDVRGLLGNGLAEQSAIGKGIIAADEPGQESSAVRRFFLGARILPLWNQFANSDIIFHENDRDHVWELRIGDIIAVCDPNGSTNDDKNNFPFRCSWRPCQVLAIFADGTNDVEDMSFEIRYLQYKASSHVKGADILELVATGEPVLDILESSDLLGPLSMIQHDLASNFDWENVPKRLPCILFHAEAPVFQGRTAAIKLASSYTKASVRTVLEALGESNSTTLDTSTSNNDPEKGGISENLSSAETTETVDAWASGDAINIDVSRLRIYYDELFLVPVDSVSPNEEGALATWKIQAGDVVLVHCDGPKRAPFRCNWGVAEIVAIWKQCQTRDNLEREIHSSDSKRESNLQVEIRWYYGRQDIVGMTNNENFPDSDEVFETDDVSELEDLSCILAPAKLHPAPEFPPPVDAQFQNFPIQNFVCRRFWSLTRKSLIPCSGLEGRIKRGRLHSRSLPKGLPPKSAGIKSMADPGGTSRSVKLSWVESVKSIVGKLNLKEASKGAYERGETLIGREKELSQLLFFFLAAIRGEAGPGGIRSSIFLAGPPGVGKTACIRAAMARLQAEQARGDVPKFTFIPLNGMEMRHPFEAYVKLLEAITGVKHIGSHEKACERLEFYFTNPKAIQDAKEEHSITIVLLDEIDYLVTEKQSVLYNFFDWPKRAAAIPNGRRLVVIGISNTLNLAEQLMPSVQSRVGSERIAFKAYNVNDAAAILRAKITAASPDFAIFEKDAILFAAKKTAAMSGDIRKAFQICRAAAELLLQSKDSEKENQKTKDKAYPTVRISDVQKASRQSFDTALVTAVSFSTPFQALLLVSLASLCRTTGREVGGFDIKDLMTKMEALVGSFGDLQYSPPPAFGEALQLLNQLAENNLVVMHTASSSSKLVRPSVGGSSGAWPMTSLAVDEHTIVRGLKNTSHKTLAEKTLPSIF